MKHRDTKTQSIPISLNFTTQYIRGTIILRNLFHIRIKNLCASVSLCSILICLLFGSCIHEDIAGPEANFESLWKIIDEQYCFLDYKHEEYGLDWDEVHTRYAQRITPDMTWENLYEVLSDMVNELRDGHVNLSSSIGTSQYRAWFDAFPHNFSED